MSRIFGISYNGLATSAAFRQPTALIPSIGYPRQLQFGARFRFSHLRQISSQSARPEGHSSQLMDRHDALTRQCAEVVEVFTSRDRKRYCPPRFVQQRGRIERGLSMQGSIHSSTGAIDSARLNACRRFFSDSPMYLS